jgi:hypothetical protein
VSICDIHPIVKRRTPMQGLVGIPGQYSYRISDTGYGSNRYGTCEVCLGHVSETYIQVETKYYFNETLMLGGWTLHQCRTLFGHEECLRRARRQIAPASE